MRTVSGTVVAVSAVPLGDELALDAAAGAVAITVDDAGIFSDDGGTVRVGGTGGVVVAYATSDDVTGILTLPVPLAGAWPAGTRVDLWDIGTAASGVEHRAMVQLAGPEDNSDSMDVSINHALIPLLTEGIRAPGSGESVVVTHDGTEWSITDVLGRSPMIDGTRIAPATIPELALSFTVGGVSAVIGPVPPTTPAPKIGDLWFDSTSGNQMNQWTGTVWAPYQYSTGAIAPGSITPAQINFSAHEIGGPQVTIAASAPGSTITRTNLVPNPAFETAGVVGWASYGVPSADATRAHSGTKSMKLVGSGVNDSATYIAPAVVAGQAYTLSVYLNIPVALAFDFILRIDWYGGGNSGGVVVPAGQVTTGVGGWQRFSVSGTATAGSTAANIGIRSGYILQASESVWLDDFLFEKAGSAGAYFDGDTQDTAAVQYWWSGAAGQSVSYAGTSPNVGDLWYDSGNGYRLNRWDGTSWVAVQLGTNAIAPASITPALVNFTARDLGGVGVTISAVAPATTTRTNLETTPNFETGVESWITTSGISALTADTTYARSGLKSLKVGGPSGSSETIYSSLYIPVVAGQSYVFSMYLKIPVGLLSAIYPSRVYWYNAAHGYLGTAVGVTVPAGTTTSGWQQFSQTLVAPASAAFCFMCLDWTSPPLGAGDSFWIDDVQVENAAALGSYFDGDTLDLPAAQYAWTGAAGSSRSTATFAPVVGDIWYDTANGYRMNRWDGSAWVPATFGTNAIAAGAITPALVNFTARAIGGVTTSYGAAGHASPLAGDLWYDSGNGYRLNRYDGSAWVPATFGTNAITAGSVTAGLIAGDTITAAQIAAGAITTSELATDSVTAIKILANTITAAKLAAGTITANEIQALSITAGLIAADTITAAQIAAGAITASELATDSVTAIKILANTITAAKIAAGTITATEIQALTITAGLLAANTITSAQIAAGTITGDRLTAGTITGDRITAGTVTGDRIAAGTLTADLIAVGAIVAGAIAAGALDAMTINAGSITSGVLSAGSIGSSHLVDSWVNRTRFVIDGSGGDLLFYSAPATTLVSLTTPGGGSWLCPAGVTSIKVECVGAGGGGRGTVSVSNQGGGGGEYSSNLIVPVTPGNSYSFTVGIGGTSGVNGGDTTFAGNSGVWVTAHGGKTGSNVVPGAGGFGSTDPIHFPGGAGGPYGGASSGGGGGSGGSAQAGNPGGVGTGGAAVPNGGQGGTGVVSGAGGAGGGPGGGGAGARTSGVGGTGAGGKITINYSQPALLLGSIASQFGVDDYGNTFPGGINMAPAGQVTAFAGTTAPSGWLLCNGASVLRASYLNLFGVIGTQYGTVDGTHFTLPDLRGRVPAGVDSGQVEFTPLGIVVGAKTVQLTAAEMPSHTHTVADGRAGSTGVSNTRAGVAGNSGGGVTVGSFASGSAGTGGAHNNIQPTIALNYIIKT